MAVLLLVVGIESGLLGSLIIAFSSYVYCIRQRQSILHKHSLKVGNQRLKHM